ncbi:MAG: prepilin-type N-terminal cleavage/methylation domain-containing protein [Candidatus Latescibacteria bacterium]|jgi:prepilin-type N-terminal cleavage/methylation domain-containing protein|nr:prepilin-type N-terminal cleavage/methylation domain-containing protein [Candidatus Latescibacterota bacterium]
MFRRNEKGFTLVELMIVVVIIGILASIAIPKFSNMIGKTKTTEAKQMLGEIVKMEKSYYYAESSYADFNAALDAEVNCPEIGFSFPDNSRFYYGFVGATTLASAKEQEDVNGDGAADDTLTLTIAGVKAAVAGTAGDDLAW